MDGERDFFSPPLNVIENPIIEQNEITQPNVIKLKKNISQYRLLNVFE